MSRTVRRGSRGLILVFLICTAAMAVIVDGCGDSTSTRDDNPGDGGGVDATTCNPATCVTGCCTAEGTCGACSGQDGSLCDPTTCPGCCAGGACVGGFQDDACGAGGVTCASCSTAGFVCVAAQCRPAVDANVGPCETEDGGADGGTVYHDITRSSCWTTFDLATVDPRASGYRGATFDGRYVYFAPLGGVVALDGGGSASARGVVARLDTQASIASASAWSTFDPALAGADDNGFAGAVFDGRYVYFVPSFAISTSGDGGITETLRSVVVRYDTTGSFATSSSWSSFDATTVSPRAEGFFGGVFDGRYVYFVPGAQTTTDGGIAGDGLVVRYDTQSTFTQSASWSTFDTTTARSSAVGFAGGVFDGRFVYFIPSGTDVDGSMQSGILARYDTQTDFAEAGSWSTFDMQPLDASPSFWGGGFDGRYVYALPNLGQVAARYDTQASFADAASWSTSAQISGLGQPATFDGRFLYHIGHAQLPDTNVDRYDTQGAFGGSSAWGAAALAGFFLGGVFDGRYVYLFPGGGGVFARFDAKVPASMPSLPAFHGSFF